MFQKAGGQTFALNSHGITADGRTTDFFFVKICFTPIKNLELSSTLSEGFTFFGSVHIG
jgi:hypothetical protein